MVKITEEQLAEAVLTELLEILTPLPNALKWSKWDVIAKVGDGLIKMNKNIMDSLDLENIEQTGYSRMKLASQIMCLWSLNNKRKQLLGLKDNRVKLGGAKLARKLVYDMEESLKLYVGSNGRPVFITADGSNGVAIKSQILTWKVPLAGEGGVLDEILSSDAASCMGIAIAAATSMRNGHSPEDDFVWWPTDGHDYEIIGDDTWNHPEIWSYENSPGCVNVEWKDFGNAMQVAAETKAYC